MALFLVTGDGTTYQSQGALTANYPYVLFGGSVTSISNPQCTGGITYYGLDNSLVDVYRLNCYQDITISPTYHDWEQFCDGVRKDMRQLQSYSSTMTLTQDVVDLKMLRLFMSQPSINYEQDLSCNIESLLISELCMDEVPILFEHHYTNCDSDETEYLGILGFNATLSLGDITIDPNEGYSAELTVNISYSQTYGAYLALMRKDSVVLV